jgi:drug/metabolite transporter (DMT)-like permease
MADPAPLDDVGERPVEMADPARTGAAPRARAFRRVQLSAATRNLLLLTMLALIWGTSFAFIKVAVRDLAPATLVLGRVAVAALALVVIVPLAIGRDVTLAEVRSHWRPLLVVGLLNTALPFWLLSWGETRIDSGLASIIQAAVPIFVAVFALAFFHEERVSRERLLGIAVGFVGVALLLGTQPEWQIVGALAVVGMAVCYAIAVLLTRRYLSTARPQVVALSATVVATVALLPAGVAQAPHRPPGWEAIASVAVLGLLGTAVAYLLYFTLIANAGASYASLVTYLVPPIALAYGAILLDERFALVAFGGLALIFAGVALGTGSLTPTRLYVRRTPRDRGD